MGVIETVIAYLADALGIEAYAEVPNPRPEVFITVERIGGAPDGFGHDFPELAVQCWAKSMYEADVLARQAAEAMARMPFSVPAVKRAAVSTVYNFPDFEGKHSRYQITASLTAV